MPSLTSNLYAFAEFRLDVQNRVLRRREETVALTPKAFEVLLLLVQHSGEIISKDQLMQAVWPDSFVEESNLTQTVFMLRKALGETADKRYILTAQGRGYKFVPEVREVSGNGHVGMRVNALKALPSELSPEHVGAGALTCPAERGSALWTGASGATQAPVVRSPHRSTRKPWLLAALTLLIVAMAPSVYLRWSGMQDPRSTPGGRLMLAVLPFRNLTGDATQEYFSDGLTEEMITQLGNLDPPRLGVIARTSVMHYKNSPEKLDQVGRELGVQYVLEGSVRRDANNVRITAQLIQMKDQSHVWARQYDRELKGLLNLQGEIAQEIADEIQLTLGEHKSAVAAQSGVSPKNYEAYDLYLKGQYFFNKRTATGLNEAIQYFQQAAAKDPSYARAYAGLADCYALMGGYTGRPPAEFIAKARAAALRALQLDDGLPEAHTALALIVQTYDWDWQTAEKQFQRAIALNPNYATAHHWYAEHLMWRGRFDEALQESERARQLDPLSLIIAADNGAILYFSRQYDRAIEKWRSVLELDPDFLRAHLIKGAYTEKEMFVEAFADEERLRPKDVPADYWSWRAYIEGRAGHAADARHALDELLNVNRHQPVDPMIIANGYVGVGDKNQALAWLEKAYAQHSNELVSLKVSPVYDALRGDPRFRHLLRRVGLAA